MVGKPDWGREGAAPSGQVRVLVLGDAGVGKTSLVHLIVNETRITNPRRTVGCAVEVKHLVYREPTTSSYTQKYRDRDFFVELWDISGHEQYKDCRSIFYSQINGVIFVHDLSQRKTRASLQEWASEVASHGSFSAPLPNGYTNSIPVPSLAIGNKSDIAPMGSSSNLVDAARQWVEKQGLLSPSDELPTTQKFPGGRDLRAAAKEGDLDLDAVRRFFVSLIQRKYYPEELMSTTPPQTLYGLQATRPGGNTVHSKRLSFDDQLLSSSSTFGGDSAYNTPWSRQERLSPPTSPSPEMPLPQLSGYTVK
ncbi:unnamed protein product [Calypogeia fissa]